MIPLLKDDRYIIPNCNLYGTAFEIIKDRLVLISAAWSHRSGKNYVTGLGFYSNGRKHQCLGIYLDMVRTDGRPKTKWNLRIVTVHDDTIYEYSHYQCPATHTIDQPLKDTDDIYLGHIVEKFKAFLVKNQVDNSLFASFDRLLKKKEIAWVEEAKPIVKETKSTNSQPPNVALQEKRAAKAKTSNSFLTHSIFRKKLWQSNFGINKIKTNCKQES